MRGVNAFEVMIHNKKADLLRIPNDYLWERNKAQSFEERDAALQKANLNFFNTQQEIKVLSDLNDRLYPEYFEEENYQLVNRG